MWCVRFLQARMTQGPRLGKGPVPMPRLVVEDLGLHALARMLAGRVMTYLPEHRRAGPCGISMSGHQAGSSAIAWSLRHLVPALQAYYEERNRERSPLSRAGLRYGAKAGGGHGRSTLW